LAGADGFPIVKDSAGAAHTHSAAEFRSGQTEVIAQDPKQWGVIVDIDPVMLVVDDEFEAGHLRELCEWRCFEAATVFETVVALNRLDSPPLL
jgi:hypothetical protein